MSIQNVKAELVCDRCKRGWYYRADSLPGIRRAARMDGWDCLTAKDYCSACAHQRGTQRATPTTPNESQT